MTVVVSVVTVVGIPIIIARMFTRMFKVCIPVRWA
jgi:hypothetical protein